MRSRTGNALPRQLYVEEGSLYPALQRMLVKGWMTGDWGPPDENRRARYYRLTPTGRKRLREEESAWRRYADAVFQVLKP